MADKRKQEWRDAAEELRNFVKSCTGAPSSFVDKFAAIANDNEVNVNVYFKTSIRNLKAALSDAKDEWVKLKKEVSQHIERRRREYQEYDKKMWEPLFFDESTGGYNIVHKLHQFSKTKPKGVKMTGGEAEKWLGKKLAQQGKAVEFLPESGVKGKSGDFRFDGKIWDCKYIPMASIESIRSYFKDAKKADCVIFC